MLLRPIPSSLRSSVVWVVMGASWVVLIGGFVAITGTWAHSPMILLGCFHVGRGLLLRRARVVVDQRGLLVNTGGFKDHFIAWEDVEAVSVDPLGGPRLMRLRRRDGREVQLPELAELDRARVLEARPR
ncbi:hypothetical protein GTR02_03675 [Kineococcus sp. R8]|uniref:PH domain-containing protein n=1 Tax=Kineococcus siccus TaxID=2696567 RepID=UPI0014135174|nr:PH domain-containing protein [Kineococcus siccus]NAZ80915.1 hypothetical protein [Kineococcus siccus]